MDEMLTVNLTEKEQAAVKTAASKIDITNETMVLQYGSSAIKELLNVAEAALQSTQKQQFGEIGPAIGEIMTDLRGLCAEETKKTVLFSFFVKKGKKERLHCVRTRNVNEKIKALAVVLEQGQLTITKEAEHLASMLERSQLCFKGLAMFLDAGRIRLARERETTLASLRVIARRTEVERDARAVEEFEQKCMQFEARLKGLLKVGKKTMALLDHLRLLQLENRDFSRKILDFLVNPLPAWKKQASLFLAKTESDDENKQAEEKKALDLVSSELITGLDAVLVAQAQCAQKQAGFEKELQRIVSILREKLLEDRIEP